MAMTMTQKILAAHAGRDAVEAGELIEARLDLVLGNDVTTPPAIKVFEAAGLKTILDPERIALVPDHFTPNKDIKSAEGCAKIRRFDRTHELEHYYEQGEPGMGVEHVILPDPTPAPTAPSVPSPQAWAPPMPESPWRSASAGSACLRA